MANPDHSKQPPTPEQTHSVESTEQVPKNDTGDLALLAEFLSDQKTTEALHEKNEFSKKALSKQADQMRQVKEIMADFSQSKTDIETALKEIDESIEYYSKQAMADVSDEEYDELIRQRNAYEQVRQFIIQNRDRDFLSERKDFANWDKEGRAERLQQQKQEEQMRQKQTAQQIEGVYKQLGVESPNEREKSREQAIQRILEDGGINLSASLQEKITQDQLYQSQTGSGYKEVIDLRFSRAIGEIGKGVGAVSRILDENGINEAVLFEQIREPILEQVTISGKSKWGGLKKEPDRIEYRQTGRYKTHADFVRKGKEETPVRVVYMVKDVETEKDNRDKYGWSDYSGRQGNQMVLEIFVPESTAQEIKRLIDNDPAFIRQIAERVMKERILKNPNDWRAEDDPKKGSIRPPYERWGTKPEGAQIYVQTEDMSPEFHKKAVRKIKK